MKILIFGAGNLLLSDEGFGVHLIHYLEHRFKFPKDVELFDAGTLGAMASHKIEEANKVYILDVVDAKGRPGDCLRYEKEDFMRKNIPARLSPHQIGIQEMLLVSEMRGRCPKEVVLLGVIPEEMETGTKLSESVEEAMVQVANQLVGELRYAGYSVVARN